MFSVGATKKLIFNPCKQWVISRQSTVADDQCYVMEYSGRQVQGGITPPLKNEDGTIGNLASNPIEVFRL